MLSAGQGLRGWILIRCGVVMMLLIGMKNAQNGPVSGTLFVTITDVATGLRSPARIRLTSLDGRDHGHPPEAISIPWDFGRVQGDDALHDSFFYVNGGFTLILDPLPV